MKESKKGFTGDFSGSFSKQQDHINVTTSEFNSYVSRKAGNGFKVAKKGTSDFGDDGIERSPMIARPAHNYYDDVKSTSDAASSLGSLNNQQERDVQEYIAEENQQRRKRIQRKTSVWQLAIFLMAFGVNQLISFRDHIVVNVD